jgi:hypothetical protein
MGTWPPWSPHQHLENRSKEGAKGDPKCMGSPLAIRTRIFSLTSMTAAQGPHSRGKGRAGEQAQCLSTTNIDPTPIKSHTYISWTTHKGHQRRAYAPSRMLTWSTTPACDVVVKDSGPDKFWWRPGKVWLATKTMDARGHSCAAGRGSTRRWILHTSRLEVKEIGTREVADEKLGSKKKNKQRTGHSTAAVYRRPLSVAGWRGAAERCYLGSRRGGL